MSATLILNSADSRARARSLVDQAPTGSVVVFQRPRRSTAQNARLWAMLTDVAAQVAHHGQRYSAEVWKDLFTAAYRRYALVPGLDAGTVVPVGMRTSEMSTAEMSDLIELIAAYGAQHGVVFGDPQPPAPEESGSEDVV